MRGKGTRTLARMCGKRITPAYAGKGLNRFRAGLIDEDHPRVCGERTKKSRDIKVFNRYKSNFI